MTKNNDNNVFSIRDNVIAEQGKMIIELMRKLEMIQDEMNHTRDLANMDINTNSLVLGRNKSPLQTSPFNTPNFENHPNNIPTTSSS